MSRGENMEEITSPLALLFMPCLLLFFLLNWTNLAESFQNEELNSFGEVEAQYAENFAGKEGFLELNATFSKPLEQVEMNEVIKLHNGHLTTLQEEIDDEIFDIWAECTEEFYESLQKDGIEFAFVLTPHKLPSDTDPMIPSGYDSYFNRNADSFLQRLGETAVPIMDLREEMAEEKMSHYDYFFLTDHHWTVYGGFWAHEKVGKLIDGLLLREDFVEDYGNLKNYELTLYEKFWSGSHGQRTGTTFSGLDDLPVIVPSFDTDIRVEMDYVDWDKRGDFSTAFLNEERLEVNPYAIYLTSDLETKITNYLAPNDTSVFIIKDSFALVMAPFLSLHYRDVYLYDMRIDGCDSYDLERKLQEIDPDVVICFYNPAMFVRDNTFQFLSHQPMTLW